jgi:phosphoribosylformylglycinamidine synthase
VTRRATVLVRPKQGILDPQGEAVLGSLRKLGFGVESVRVGRVIDVELEADDPAEARRQLERMCSELLANPLIESFEVELDDGSSTPSAARAEAADAEAQA